MKKNILLSTIAVSGLLLTNETTTLSNSRYFNPILSVSAEGNHEHDHDHGIAEIIIAITENGYVTMHGDHPHTYNGEVPEDALIAKELVTDQKGEIISHHHAGQVVKINEEYLFLPNGKEPDLIVDLEEEHHHEQGHEDDTNENNIIAKEGDVYLVPHGDHYHEVPVSDFSEEEQEEIDQYLADHPNLKKEYEKAKEIYAGYFEDDEVEARELTDWEGDWQSVYPYLIDGTLDPVMDKKADHHEEMTAEDYKAYYEIGYQTDVAQIIISTDTIKFIKDDGSQYEGKYEYTGYEILEYQKGNRGVRYLFTKIDGDEEAYNSIQFSDHNIAPKDDLQHYHIYFSDIDHDELLEEMEHWPTYYPTDWTADDILHDQLNH